MNEINKALEKIKLDYLAPGVKALILSCMNFIESLSKTIKDLTSEIQILKDENNRLKGEQGKPSIRANTKDKDISSEKERKAREEKTPKKKRSKAKNHKLVIHRTERIPIDKSTLPSDAKFTGLRRVIVQDILISPNNVLFECEEYYSASEKKVFSSSVPPGYEGQFGPNIKALIKTLHHDSKMTLEIMVSFFKTFGTMIAKSTVSLFLTTNVEEEEKESKEIVEAGLLSVPFKQLDDTGARVKGKSWFTHILCNSLFTSFHTRPHKNRLTVIEILTQKPLTFLLNDLSYTLMIKMKIPEKAITWLKDQKKEESLTESQFDGLLEEFYPSSQKNQQAQKNIKDAAAIAAYREHAHSLNILLTDDAPQFKAITKWLALCWIHEGRPYKKLSPILDLYKKYTDTFLKDFWDYYRSLLAYKESPTPKKAKKLSKEFDVLFSRKTGYQELDDRAALTKAQKENLLLVLQFPDLPLHNNASELAAREQARRRDISFHTMSLKGTVAKDAFMTIVATAKKHNVNVYDYFLDRITKTYEMTSLADLILQKSSP